MPQIMSYENTLHWKNPSKNIDTIISLYFLAEVTVEGRYTITLLSSFIAQQNDTKYTVAQGLAFIDLHDLTIIVMFST